MDKGKLTVSANFKDWPSIYNVVWENLKYNFCIIM